MRNSAKDKVSKSWWKKTRNLERRKKEEGKKMWESEGMEKESIWGSAYRLRAKPGNRLQMA